MQITPKNYQWILIETSDCRTAKVRQWELIEKTLDGELKLREIKD